MRAQQSEVCREPKTAGLLAIGPLGLMAGGPEDHFTDSRELYVLVEGDAWAHVEALDPDACVRDRPSCRFYVKKLMVMAVFLGRDGAAGGVASRGGRGSA